MDNEVITQPTNSSTNIQTILDKIKTLSISNDDKALLMNQFKQNIMNPSQGEDKNLDHIQQKYLGSLGSLGNLGQSPLQLSDTNHIHNQYQQQPNNYSYNSMSQPMLQPMLQPMSQSNLMTTAHFEILKNKIDSLQYELIDLLRHVKDYTQRYMNSVRQQDLVKIDEYINSLFEVDKNIKETKEKVEEAAIKATDTLETEEPATEQSIITKATNGIKNFMGSIGDNVSGITKLVKSTADVANGYLSTNIIKPSTVKNNNTSNVSITNKPNITNKSITTNKNIVSVEEYMNMNKETEKDKNTLIIEPDNKPDNTYEDDTEEPVTEEPDTEEPVTEEPVTEHTETNSINLNANNINNLSNEETIPEETIPEENIPEDISPDSLGNALKELNDKMNEDINNTLKEKNVNTNTVLQQGGSQKTQKLKKNIEILKLKLTKKKLQKELTITNNKRLNKHKMTKNKIQRNKKNNKKSIKK